MRHSQKVSLASFLLGASLLGASLLTGCGGSSSSNTSSLITPQPRSLSKITTSGLTATFAENVDAIGQNGSITYTVTLTNSTSLPVAFLLQGCVGAVPDPSHPDAYFTVTDANGAVAYTDAPVPVPCPPGTPVTQTIAVGQSLTTQVQVKDSARTFGAKGVYTASTAVVTSSGGAELLGPLTLTVQ